MRVEAANTAKYLERIVELGLLSKEKFGKENYYINTRLIKLFIDFGEVDTSANDDHIESIQVKEKPIS